MEFFIKKSRLFRFLELHFNLGNFGDKNTIKNKNIVLDIINLNYLQAMLLNWLLHSPKNIAVF
jgi:hypothetical protein